MPGDHPAVSRDEILQVVQRALSEDLPSGDATTAALFPDPVPATGIIRAKQALTVAGIALATETFRQVDLSLSVTVHADDGQAVEPAAPLLTIQGDGRSILTAERVALNFLQHLSGIATLTAAFCRAVQDYPVTLLDTRKTTPGLRALQKWAVRLGGGTNHRYSLSDAIMIKDNHLLLASRQGRSLTECCLAARSQGRPGLRVTVEVERLDQVPMALEGGADVILLDNMTPDTVRRAVEMIQGRAHTEVSGGITLRNVVEYAAAGPTFISIGALTHSAPAVDISLNLAASPP